MHVRRAIRGKRPWYCALVRFSIVLLAIGYLLAMAQNAPVDSEHLYHFGDEGVTPPHPRSKPEPEYTKAARDSHIQGTVGLEIIVDERGKVAGIQLLSPLGFGLDESAEATISRWTFDPATKDGKPVKMVATIDVNFKLLSTDFDEKAERKRVELNEALQTIKRKGRGDSTKAIESIRKLAQNHFPPAMYLEALLLEDGVLVPKEPDRSLDLLLRAADARFAPAMYEVGKRYVEGRGFPPDPTKGVQMIDDAAALGDKSAQFDMGLRYASGNRVPKDDERAMRYFRYCAAQAVAVCEFNLGDMLLGRTRRKQRDTIEAIAWLELASDHGVKQAAPLLAKELPLLTPKQTAWVEDLKSHLVKKP